MFALLFIVRVSVVALLIALQVYCITTYGIEIGVAWCLLIQVSLQLDAVLIAPAYLRPVAAVAAGWSMIVVAQFLAIFWVTLVVPIAVLMGAMQGSQMLLLQFIARTAFMSIPFGIYHLALALYDDEDILRTP